MVHNVRAITGERHVVAYSLLTPERWSGRMSLAVQGRLFTIPLRTDKVINVAAVTHRSPFRYPGGKTWLVPHVRTWLTSLSEKPLEFAEPFAGGAIVGLSVLFEALAEKLTLVELDEDIGAVWRVVLSNDSRRLTKMITSFDVNLQSVRRILDARPTSVLDRAFATIVRNRMQRGGIMAPGASLMKNGENGRGLKSRWYPETLRKRIESISEVKDRISFICGDGIEFLRYHSYRKDAIFFIDPPYTVAGRRLYRYPEIDHEQLFRVVSSITSDFLMTYDNSAEIKVLARRFGFDTQEIAMKNTHHEVMSEMLIGRCLDWSRRSAARESSPQNALAMVTSQR